MGRTGFSFLPGVQLERMKMPLSTASKSESNAAREACELNASKELVNVRRGIWIALSKR